MAKKKLAPATKQVYEPVTNMNIRYVEGDELRMPTFLLRGHPDCPFNSPAPVMSRSKEPGPWRTAGPGSTTKPTATETHAAPSYRSEGRKQETAIMAKTAKKAAPAAESLEGKSIAELVVIFNTEATAAGQPNRSTFKNAAAGIKAIEGLRLTAATPAPAPAKGGKKAPVQEKAPAKKKDDDGPRDQFGSRPGSLKETLLAMLTKAPGKPVGYKDAMDKLYGKDADGAIAGVIKGAEIAIAAAGGRLEKQKEGNKIVSLTYFVK